MEIIKFRGGLLGFENSASEYNNAAANSQLCCQCIYSTAGNYAAEYNAAEIKNAASEDKDAYAFCICRKDIMYILFI